MPQVQLPDGRTVDFPDGASLSDMDAAIRRDFSPLFVAPIQPLPAQEIRDITGAAASPEELSQQNFLRSKQLGVEQGQTSPGLTESAGNVAKAAIADLGAFGSLFHRPQNVPVTLLPSPTNIRKAVTENLPYAAAASGNVPAAVRSVLTPEPLPIDTTIAEAAKESTGAATTARISQDIAATAPLLVVGGLPGFAQKAALAGFTADMLLAAPEVATELGKELGKPVAEQDPNRLASLYSQAVQIAGFATAGGLHVTRPVVTELLKTDSPKTAVALAQPLKGALNAESTRTSLESVRPEEAQRLESGTEGRIRVRNDAGTGMEARAGNAPETPPQIISGEQGTAPKPSQATTVPPENRAVEPSTPPPTPSPESPAGASKTNVTPPVTEMQGPGIVGMGGAIPAEFEAKPTTPTSIKNAQVDVERAQRGLPPAIEPARRSFGKVWDEAMAKIDHDPFYPDTLLDELRAKPRSLTDTEDAVLLRHQIDLQNEYGKATRDLAQAAEDAKTFPNRMDAVESEKARVAALSDQLLDLYNIGKKVGTETGRGLNARKMMAFEDYSLAKMELDRRAINDGERLTDEQQAETVRLNQKIEQTQKAFDDFTTQAEAKQSETALNDAINTAKKTAVKRAPKDIDTQQSETTSALKVKFEKGEREDISSLVQKLARLFVERGIRERDPLIDAVHGVLKELDPNFTRRETMDAISGYGQFRQLTKDEISVKLRDLKGQMQQVAKLEDMQANRPPLKTGMERRVPSPEESRLIKLVNQAKNEFQIPIDDPNVQLKSSLDELKTRLKNRTLEFQDKLKRGDFEKKPRRIIQMDPEANRLHLEMSKAKAAWHEALMKDRLAKRSVARKIWDTGGEILNTSRAVLTSMDLSAVLRQGGFIAFAHPVRALKSFPAMFRAFTSEAGQHAVDREILARKNYPLYAQSKLYLSEHGQKLSQMEEAYMSRWADKIPLVAGSQRAYVTFLNKLRADSFDAMANSLARNKELTPAEAAAISNFINVATGRGNLGMKENALVGLNTIFFAPRYVASRFQLLAGQPLYRGTARTRAAIAGEYARYLIGVALVYALAKQDGATIESDPRSADFGKLKYGNTRLDPISGLAQTSVLTGRLAAGETKRANGKVVPIRGPKVPFGSPNSADVMASFLRSKLAPVPGAIVNTLTGKDVVGQPVTIESTAKNLLVPLSFSEIAKTMQEQGVDRGTAMAILSIFGMGLQNYDATKRPTATP